MNGNQSLGCIVIVAVLLVCFIALVAAFKDYGQSLENEFRLEWIVSSIERYVETHRGELPASWLDIELGFDLANEQLGKCPWTFVEISSEVEIDFSLNRSQFLKGSRLMHASHVDEQFLAEANDELRSAIRRTAREKRTEVQSSRRSSEVLMRRTVDVTLGPWLLPPSLIGYVAFLFDRGLLRDG
jgi:hypothetical protein